MSHLLRGLIKSDPKIELVDSEILEEMSSCFMCENRYTPVGNGKWCEICNVYNVPDEEVS